MHPRGQVEIAFKEDTEMGSKFTPAEIAGIVATDAVLSRTRHFFLMQDGQVFSSQGFLDYGHIEGAIKRYTRNEEYLVELNQLFWTWQQFKRGDYQMVEVNPGCVLKGALLELSQNNDRSNRLPS